MNLKQATIEDFYEDRTFDKKVRNVLKIDMPFFIQNKDDDELIEYKVKEDNVDELIKYINSKQIFIKDE